MDSEELSNQAMLDYIEDGFPKMPIGLREKLLDAIWNALVDNRTEPQWMKEAADGK